MKIIAQLLAIVLLAGCTHAPKVNGSPGDQKSLDNATLAIREAFAKGDAALVASLHHPNIVKYFGGNNIVTGRAALQSGLANWFKTTNIEFVENKVESTVFTGNTAVQVAVFAIKSTPKAGGAPSINRGRSLVVYVRDSTSSTGWLSLREMTQEAPAKDK